MNAEKMREEFELWQIKNMLEHGVTEVMARASLAQKDGKYGPFVEFAWTIWQASRAALVVELPRSPRGYPANEASSDVDYWIDEAKWEMWAGCKRAIEAAGVRVK